MRGKYLELGKKIDKIIESNKPFEDELDEIIKELQEVNKEDFNTKGKTDKTTTIARTLCRARGLTESGIGDEVVHKLLRSAKSLLVFEDLKEKIKADKKPTITNEDIQRVKDTNWLPKSRPMVGLLEALEKIEQKKFSKYKKQKKTFDANGKKETKIKEVSVNPVKEARACINNIRTESKLIMTVQFLRIIAEDYLTRHDIKLPSEANLNFEEEDLSENYEIRVHQLLYNLSCDFEGIVDDLMVNENYAKTWNQRNELREKLFKWTSLLDKKSRVPKEITQDTYHAASTYLHVFVLLKRLVKSNVFVKGLLTIVWPGFYKEAFKNPRTFYDDLSKNSMYTNLMSVIEDYEETVSKNGVSKSNHKWDDFDSAADETEEENHKNGVKEKKKEEDSDNKDESSSDELETVKINIF